MMRSLLRNKRLILLLSVLALGALTLLATSLDEVPFREAQRYSREETAEAPVSAADVAQVWATVPIWKLLVVLGLAFLLVLLVSLLLSRELRKRLLLLFIRVAFTFWAVYFFLTHYGDRFFGLQSLAADSSSQSAEGTTPMPVFEPPQVSPAFTYIISFAFALLWLVVVWGLYRGWKKYQQLNNQKPLEELARIARSSLDELASGRNSSDVIINCYLRMSDVVSSRRQLHRAVAMTPHEFALRLEQAGLPGDAVRRLTSLFEGVRYGDRRSGPKDVNEAVSCLTTILNYCGEPV